jgi:stage II sporulation protein D
MRRVLLSTAAVLCLAATAGPLSGAQAATVQVIKGAGFGHGIGMSQYGAYGMAQQGRGYAEILRHYYTGTRLGQAPARPIRVILQASDPYVRFRGATRASGGKKLDPSLTYVVRSKRGRLSLKTSRGKRVGTFSAPLKVYRRNRALRLLGPAIQGVVSGRYRGSMLLYPGALGGVTAINSLPLDLYIQGVVASEVPASWDLDALRTQAVAARTYALTTNAGQALFDQWPDTRSQMYRGVVSETAATNEAVRDTSNEVVTYDGEPVATFYFSTSGGRTENIENSFIGATPQAWLKSVEDPYDDISPRHRWERRFSNTQMGALLGSPGTLKKVEVLERGVSPRVVRARVVGSRGSRILTGPQIRSRLGLDDTWAYFTRVSASSATVRGARAASAGLRTVAGSFVPAPRSRRLSVERRGGGGNWQRAGSTVTTANGRFRASVGRGGVYRVSARGVSGPAVHVR